MLLVNGYDLAPRDHIGEQLVECPGLHSFRVITHVSTKDTVLGRKFTIQSNSQIIFSRNLLVRKGKNSGIAASQERPVRQWIKRGEKPRYRGIDIDICRGKLPISSRSRWDSIHSSHAQRLAKPLVVAK